MPRRPMTPMPRALLALAALALGADAKTVDSRIPTALQPGLRRGGEALTSGLPPDGLSSLQHLNRTGTGGMGGGVNEPGKPRAVNASTEEYPQADENSLMCLTNTGGTCWMQDCHPWRGATCIWNVCRCTIGTCAGADGKCYAQQNKVDQDPVRFRNVAWPDRQLAMDRWSVRTVSDPGFGQAPTVAPETEFILVRLPDGEPMLASKASPGYVLVTKEEDRDEDGNEMRTKKVVMAQIGSRPATALASRFTSVPWKDGAVIISSNLRRFQDDYYLAWYGNGIEFPAWWSSKDPGEMGYWMPDRPLGVELKRFEGQRCEFDCNHIVWTLIEALFVAFLLAFIGVAITMFWWIKFGQS
mmetsp:Transcript_48682/g.106033  ORF Transcript_48682/g.106033 Transcript_48682/m.106033 type:complete len:356 (+) Transcript_48682:120-1187(+)